MKSLSAYPHPPQDTGLGIHDSENAYGQVWRDYGRDAFLALLKAHHMTWFKMLVADEGKVEMARILKEAGIEPIVRIMLPGAPNPGSDWRSKSMVEVAQHYIFRGVRYFELSNEPNLKGEWEGEHLPSNAPGLVAERYIYNAGLIEAIGGINLVPALSPGGNWFHDAFYRTFMEEMRLRNGWANIEWPAFGLHNRPAGHPLAYPNDPINQADHPGATLEEDSTCFRLYEWLDNLIVRYLGGHVPLFGTEAGYDFGDSRDYRYGGGWWIPHSQWYNAPNIIRHAEINMEIVRALQDGIVPDYVLCQCWWKGWTGQNESHDDQWPKDTLWGNLHFGGDLPLAAALVKEEGWLRTAGAVLVPPPSSPSEGGNMVQFKYGFKILADQLGAEVVGEPEAEQWDEATSEGTVLHVQPTTKGRMEMVSVIRDGERQYLLPKFYAAVSPKG